MSECKSGSKPLTTGRDLFEADRACVAAIDGLPPERLEDADLVCQQSWNLLAAEDRVEKPSHRTTPWTSDEIDAAAAFMEELDRHPVTGLDSDTLLRCIRAALETLDLKRGLTL